MSIKLYDEVSIACSKLTTNKYSTSFTIAILTVNKQFRDAVYGLYGFVRMGDEIVDTFHHADKKYLLDKFRNDARDAVKNKISLNPLLNSFQKTVNAYKIDAELYELFLDSMEMDLKPYHYNREEYEKYILGSAEVVGLMILRVFCELNEELYNRLKPYGMKLGSAYQKINFLRDMHADYFTLGRAYFPNVKNVEEFTPETKKQIEDEIENDFKMGLQGIRMLPYKSRFGVYLTYVYYYSLLKKIRKISPTRIVQERIRISDFRKYTLMISCYIKHRFNWL